VGGSQNPATFDDTCAADIDPRIACTTHEALKTAHKRPRMRSRFSSADDTRIVPRSYRRDATLWLFYIIIIIIVVVVVVVAINYSAQNSKKRKYRNVSGKANCGKYGNK